MAEERSIEDGAQEKSGEIKTLNLLDKNLVLGIPVPFLQKIIAEIFGTYFLIFAGCGAITVNNKKNGVVTFPGVFIVWGMAVTAMIYAVGHISGAHFNPAVTIAFATARRFPWKQVPAYVLAQMLGAILASWTLRLLFGGHRDLFSGTIPTGSDAQSLVMEFVTSFYLMFVISSVATDNRAIGNLAGLAVGATLLINVAIAGPISGASMNPARTFGPAIIANRYKSIWVYLVGPISGTIAGTWCYNLLRYTETPLKDFAIKGAFCKKVKMDNSQG